MPITNEERKLYVDAITKRIVERTKAEGEITEQEIRQIVDEELSD